MLSPDCAALHPGYGLTGAQITSPTRQAAIKRALLPLFTEEERKVAKAG
jgi:hypothetical protein